MLAFSSCRGLLLLVLPDSIDEIAEDAFEGCNQLEQVLHLNVFITCSPE